MIGPTIEGERIFLRSIEESDANENYLSWFYDPETGKYIEYSKTKPTIQSLLDYVRNIRASPKDCMFAIIDRATNAHVGNIKLGPIDGNKGVVGILVGDKRFWGKRYGTEAINLLLGYAFKTLGLASVKLGVDPSHTNAIKSYENTGFRTIFRAENKIVMEIKKSDFHTD